PLPMRSVETLPDERDLGRVITARHDLFRAIAAEHPVEDLVGPCVADAEISLVGLSNDEISRGCLADHDLRYTQMPCECPHLGLEEIAQWIDRRRVVGVPGEVTEETLRLVSRAQGNRVVTCRLVE